MTIKVYADELLRLAAGDIENEEFFDLKDLENETEHLSHLRSEPIRLMFQSSA